jgi:hypothetical protein
MAPAVLFCPKCADPMKVVDGEVTCVSGEMGLSKAMLDALIGRFEVHFRASSERPASSAPWFCPACRVPLGPDLDCTGCGQALADLRFQLVEFHPHRGWPPASTSGTTPEPKP